MVVDPVGQMSLEIQKPGIVFSLLIEAPQQIAVGFITDTRDVGQPSPEGQVFHMYGASQETGRCRPPEFRRPAVFDVQHTRHLVPVFRLKSSG